jgi:hypothetical protein
MFFSINRWRHRDADTDQHEAADDRDLIALVNEARTPSELRSITQLARMRRGA